MIYTNDDNRAVGAMELARLGDYGGYDTEYGGGELVCPICGMYEPDLFYINDEEECVGCSGCVYSSDRPY